ncbi:unnamed protein product [Rotaria sordida]|uniref:Uncharacterized protein n=1 Tax=Rotaria sordida TaxID=392033 RepID=A0A815DCU5_9BILA|nr:unnamed protein product [Rotaria sordida]CAF1569626.1 unnamed protein product [Rotaria sordida]
MSSSQVKWDCSQCGCAPNDCRKYCTECHSMLTWTCTGSGKSGWHSNYYRHRNNYSYCTPELEEEKQQEMEEKQQQLQALDDSK